MQKAFIFVFLCACGVSAPPERQRIETPPAEPQADVPPEMAPSMDTSGATGSVEQPAMQPEQSPPPQPAPQMMSGGCNAQVAAVSVCDAPFVPDSDAEGFERLTTRFFTVLQGDANHRGMDAVVNPGDEQILIARFAYGAFDADLVHEKVEVWVERVCGNWEKIGTVWTSDNAELPETEGVTDHGGSIFFHVPANLALDVGDHRVKMLVKGDNSEANLTLHVWPKGKQVVVSDIDGTMTTRETDGAWTWLDGNSPARQEGSAEMMSAYFAKGYQVIFLTARPEHLTNKTRQWFADHGFPPATFHLSESTFGETGTAAHDYKLEYLQKLAGRGVVIDAAYGNKDTDLNAYFDAGLDPWQITLISGQYTGPLSGATMVDDYVDIAQAVGCSAPL